jgi:GNAT superfamily N-acetyltransferase
MNIRRATTEDLNEIISMAKDHPEPEYDCTFEYFADFLKKLFPLSFVQTWVADDDGLVGYVIAIKDTSGLKDQIDVFDVYVKNKYRFGTGRDLLNAVKKWAIDDNVKRIAWTSKISLRGWERFMGFKVNEYHSYYWENE